MTTNDRQALAIDAELQGFATFRGRHDDLLRAVHAKAAGALGFPLDVEVFALRVYEAWELVFGDAEIDRRRAARFIQSLHHSDLYHASAALDAQPEALAALSRWYRAPLSKLAHDPAVVAELLDRHGPSASLSAYHGLSSLRRWLTATVARQVTGPLVAAASIVVPESELRRTLETTPNRWLDEFTPQERLGLSLLLVRGAPTDRVGPLLQLPPARLSSLLTLLGRDLRRAVDKDLRSCGLGRKDRRSRWSRIAEQLQLESRRPAVVAAAVLRNRRRAEIAVVTTDCPPIDVLLAGIDGLAGVDRDPVLEHAVDCWRCQSGLEAALPPPTHRPLVGWKPLLAAAAAAVLALVLWAPHPLLEPYRARLTSGLTPVADLLQRQSTASPPAAQAIHTPQAVAVAAEVFPLQADPSPASRQTPPLPVAAGPSTVHHDAGSRSQHPRAVPTPDGSSVAIAPANSTTVNATTAPPPTPRKDSVETGAPTPPALRRAPGDGRAALLLNIALDRHRAGADQDTLDIALRATQLQPDLAEAHLACAILLDRLERPGEARQHWLRYAGLGISAADARYLESRLGPTAPSARP